MIAALHQCAADVLPHEDARNATEVGFLSMTIQNLDRSLSFYQRALGFAHEQTIPVSGDDWERLTGSTGAKARAAVLRLGDESLELVEYESPVGRPFPADTRSNDAWFQHAAIVVSNMDAAHDRLRSMRVEAASAGPQEIPAGNAAAAGIRAFYFRDPDGHYLELLQFPRDKGLAKWHGRQDDLFLGIDHTAIVVADTERSLAFYRDALGLKVVGESLNYGPEQERLNGIAGSHVQITTLRAPTGPGVELLEYVTPGAGRSRPADARPNDVLHWQTAIAVPDVGRSLQAIGALDDVMRSSGSSVLTSDPDGHVVALISST